MEGQARRYRHTWRASVFSSFLNPLLYLLAMGVGLGTLVDSRGGPEGFGYLQWLAPGLVLATAMQVGFFESSYPVLAAIKWTKSYDSALATPIETSDLVVGHLCWVAVRLIQVSVVFGAVAAGFGAISLAAVPGLIFAALLTGLAFSAATVWFTAHTERDPALSSMLRFGITPLFLFSGTFFPIEQLPAAMRPLAYLTPLWHGVELARTWALGIQPVMAPAIHVAVLVGVFAIGVIAATARLSRRLIV